MSKFRKKQAIIPLGKRGLILCAGITEENYFKGLVSQEKYRRKFQSIDVQIYKPKDNSLLGLVTEAKDKIKLAKKEKNDYDFVWVIFDKDGHANIPTTFENARQSKPEIKIAFVRPCFEYYVLLHFEKTTKPFTKCDEVISYIKKNHLPDYEKAINLFELLVNYKTTGLENSKWVSAQKEEEINLGTKIYDLSAYSNIHEIVEFLYSLL